MTLTKDPQSKSVFIRFSFLLCFGLIFYFLRVLPSPKLDLEVYLQAARNALVDSSLIYKNNRDVFLYPPQAAWLFIPFTWIKNTTVIKSLWYAINLFMSAVLIRKSWVAFAAFFILSRYATINFYYGQVNLLVLMLSISSHQLHQRKNSLWAAAILATNTIIKIFPGLYVVNWFIEKKWKLILCYSSFLFLILMSPFLIHGFTSGMELYRDMLGALAHKDFTLYSHNQSIQAFIARFLSGQSFDLFSVARVNWSIAAWPEIWIKLSAFSIGLGLSFLAWRKAARRGLPWDGLSAFFFTFLFISPLVWKTYFIFLFPVWLQIFYHFEKAIFKKGEFYGFVLVTFFLSPDVVGFPLATRLDALCIHLWGAAITLKLWLALPQASNNSESIQV